MIGALVIGLVGSLHCVGMCGPLMLTLTGPNQSKSTFLIYHAGRISSYVFLGLMLGIIGQSFEFIQIQKAMTVSIGMVLMAIYLFPKTRNSVERYYYQSWAYGKVKLILAKNLSSKKRWFISGVANGFLPCGLTYVAAAAALVLGSLWSSMAFMILFGLGTLPALASVSFGSTLLSVRFKKIIPSAVPVLGVLSGTILLFRGLIMTFPNLNQLVQENVIQLITICGL